MTWRKRLEAFCAGYGPGFLLAWDTAPDLREDALGLAGATSHAQLCSGRVVAAKPDPDSLHSIAHEVGHAMACHTHGTAGLDNEELVTVEQIAFLVRWSRHLMLDSEHTKGQESR